MKIVHAALGKQGLAHHRPRPRPLPLPPLRPPLPLPPPPPADICAALTHRTTYMQLKQQAYSCPSVKLAAMATSMHSNCTAGSCLQVKPLPKGSCTRPFQCWRLLLQPGPGQTSECNAAGMQSIALSLHMRRPLNQSLAKCEQVGCLESQVPQPCSRPSPARHALPETQCPVAHSCCSAPRKPESSCP